MLLELAPKEPQRALPDHGRPRHYRTITTTFDKSTELQQRSQIFFRALPVLDLLQQGREVDRAHLAGRALPAAFDFEEVRVLQRRRHHAGPVVHDDHAGRPEAGPRMLETLEIDRRLELVRRPQGEV